MYQWVGPVCSPTPLHTTISGIYCISTKVRAYNDMPVNPGAKGNVAELGVPKPQVIRSSDAAKIIFRKFQKETLRLSDLGSDTSSMWVRAAETAKKFALILAGSRFTDITAEDVEYGCAHSKNTTSEMFQMTKVMEQNYPDFIKPLSHYSGKQELTWGSVDGKGLNSRYGMSTVEGSEVVGAGIDMLHCSEVARWGSRAKEYATGLMNCVMQGYGTEIWLESTAKGVGNYFEREWWRTEKNDSGLKPVFFPWFVFDEYETELTEEEKKDDSFIKTMGNNPTFGAEEEKGLLGVEISYKTKEGDIVFKITPENLKWRRNKIISPEKW